MCHAVGRRLFIPTIHKTQRQPPPPHGTEPPAKIKHAIYSLQQKKLKVFRRTASPLVTVTPGSRQTALHPCDASRCLSRCTKETPPKTRTPPLLLLLLFTGGCRLFGAFRASFVRAILALPCMGHQIGPRRPVHPQAVATVPVGNRLTHIIVSRHEE